MQNKGVINRQYDYETVLKLSPQHHTDRRGNYISTVSNIMSHDNNVLLSRYTLGNVLAIPDFDTLKHLMIKDVNKIQSNFHSIWKSTYSCFHIKNMKKLN